MKKSLFITLEGPEGSGKTTCKDRIVEFLKKEGYEVVVTREPGGVEIAEEIRGIILNNKNTQMDPKTEALLYAAARRQHLIEKVVPALEQNKIVICDRFVHSSLAYQGAARGIGVQEIMEMNKFAIEGYMPDLTIYFEIDPKIGLERIASNESREVNRLDKEKLDFHYKVKNAYDELEKSDEKMKKVDASKNQEEVAMQVIEILKKEITKY